MNNLQVALLEELNESGLFNGLVDDIMGDPTKWTEFLEHNTAEDNVPEPWMSGNDVSLTNENARVLKQMILMKIVRPDRLISFAAILCKKILTPRSLEAGAMDLQKIAESTDASNPMCLVSAPGFDASSRVEILAQQTKKKYKAVAIGSPEAFD